MTYIISNQIKCNLCGDTPFSMHQHHYNPCECGAVAVDGGQEYLRRIGNDWEEMAITIDNYEDLEEVVKVADAAGRDGRNPLGVVIATMRAIRDGNLTVKDNHWSVLDDNTL